ncbi:uncharacterized protein [Phyllobates terribilis]|uniref:uncharacterized protein n=1 Tax=Phyllobates terribilis TaxID=111132 RepID=UPI003CCB36B1
MVSMNPSSPEGFYLDADGMPLPGLNPFATSPSSSATPTNAAANAAQVSSAASDDASKKIRKPYTITKSRESWTEPEHDKFLEALQLFDRDWKKIEAFVGSKTVIQIRSHAQKYFLKVQKSGSNEHLPPPRPKRKAAHPYPQKAPKNDTSAPVRNTNSGAPVSSWTGHSAQPAGVTQPRKGDMRSAIPQAVNNCSSSAESTPKVQAVSDKNEPMNHGPTLRDYMHGQIMKSLVLPDFAQVYSYIGSVFDPDSTDHLPRLRKMDPIDVETVLLLMRNLSINLANPDFEEHRKLLSSYDIDSDKSRPVAANDTSGYERCEISSPGSADLLPSAMICQLLPYLTYFRSIHISM